VSKCGKFKFGSRNFSKRISGLTTPLTIFQFTLQNKVVSGAASKLYLLFKKVLNKIKTKVIFCLKMITFRSLRLFQRTSIVTSTERSLKIYPSEAPIKMEIPEKHRLPVVPKMPSELMHFIGKIPKGTREMYRMMGEERVHTQLLLGQYAIVAIHGGLMKQQNFEVMRNYISRKLKPGKSFAFYRVDAPYKVGIA
jgi:hypothetical protein